MGVDRKELDRRIRDVAAAMRVLATLSGSRIDQMTALLLELAARSREPRGRIYFRGELRRATDPSAAATQTLTALAGMKGRRNQRGLTVADIASLMKVSKPTARSWLLGHGVKLRRQGNKDVIRQEDLTRLALRRDRGRRRNDLKLIQSLYLNESERIEK
jgi:hypothetical protein